MNTMPIQAAVAPAGSYEMTRFNALRHAVLSRYTVSPWEDESEYRALLAFRLISMASVRSSLRSRCTSYRAGTSRSWAA
jgi:hypothetical protein